MDGSGVMREVRSELSAPYPTRLETRTKECSMRASRRVLSKPEGGMKVTFIVG